MTLTKWKPFGDLLSLHDRVDRLFEDSFKRDLPQSAGFDTWYPVSDIYETKDEYVFKLEVPGMTRDDVNIEFHDNVLSIKGEKKQEKEVKEENYHRIESYIGSFSRSFTVPQNADPKNISASMKDGMLELRIAKSEEKKPRAIAIDVR